jgi:hypothetical protein
MAKVIVLCHSLLIMGRSPQRPSHAFGGAGRAADPGFRSRGSSRRRGGNPRDFRGIDTICGSVLANPWRGRLRVTGALRDDNSPALGRREGAPRQSSQHLLAGHRWGRQKTVDRAFTGPRPAYIHKYNV